MRKKTDKEKEVLGKAEVILRLLQIDKENAGYAPLLDVIAYAYASPNKELMQIIETLSQKNYYLGIHTSHSKMDIKAELYSKIVHTVKTAIECGRKDYLVSLELDGLKVILQGNTGQELEELLIPEIGEKYRLYSNDEKIVHFFIKKILKAVKEEG